MKVAAFFVLIVVLIVGAFTSSYRGQAAQPSNEPRFTADGQLMVPENYREWIWLSSGLGMTYGTNAAPPENPAFDNVFVTPQAYRSFLQNGVWPDKTMFVLELRGSQTKGSINTGGRFQGDVRAIEVEVKDEKRFPNKWGFFEFRPGTKTSAMLPTTRQCYSCHEQNGAVDNTFVQFYPTLIEVAKRKGTFKAAN